MKQPFYVMQDLVQIHVAAEDTEDAAFVIEVTVAPGGGPPPLHTHPASEFFYTLEGTLTYFREDEVISGGPGTTAFIPGGVPHTYRNLTDEPARYVALLTPGRQMQEFLIEAAGEGRAPEEVLAIGERYGMRTLDLVPAG
jgi:quercetin dioxygenase-like cupin family protein